MYRDDFEAISEAAKVMGQGVPDGGRLFFLDGNTGNFEMQNLLVVTLDEALKLEFVHLNRFPLNRKAAHTMLGKWRLKARKPKGKKRSSTRKKPKRFAGAESFLRNRDRWAAKTDKRKAFEPKVVIRRRHSQDGSNC